jgi:6-phosphogluconolactonase (cycloisomerase 2 family)
MKLRNIGRAVWAGAVSVGLVLGVAACGQDNTIDYLFVANAKNNPGQINVYLVDGESGSLRQILDSPYPSGAANGGRNPISLVTSPNQLYLYALNHDDNTIVKFGIGTDAKLYPNNTYNTPGNSPTAMKMNAAGTYLYVLDAFQPQYNATSPGPGAVVVYPINSDGTLGTPLNNPATGQSYFPTCNNPVDLNVLANDGAVYVVDDPASQPPKLANTVSSIAVGSNGTSTITYPDNANYPACATDSGQISAFNVGSSGALTEIAGSPFTAGVTPTAIASDPGNHFVYVADLTPNQLLSFGIGANNALTELTGGVTTGSYPDALTIDSAGHIYVANYNENSLSIFSIDPSTGIPSATSGANSYAVSTAPTFVFIEPSAGKFLYTADFVDNTVYGAEITSSTGALSAVENDPFPAAGQPTAIAAIIHHKVTQN